MLLKRLLLFATVLLLINACEKKGDNTNTSIMNKPAAKGQSGELILVMDTTKWKDALGDAVREVFSAPLPGTLRGERYFTVRHIDPLKLNDFLKHHKNLVIVTSMESNSSATRRLKTFFNTESLERIAQDPNQFMFTLKDHFARGQLALFLFGQTDAELIANLKKHKTQLLDLYNETERQRMAKGYFKLRAKDNLEGRIKKALDVDISLPMGYLFVMDSVNKESNFGFAWARSPEVEVDRNILIAYTEYESEAQFTPGNIIAWRDELCKLFIYEDPERPETFVLTETLDPPVLREVNIDGKYAVEIRGLWKTNNSSMGGSFIGYVFADPEKRRIYYTEGFVYAPSKMRKREYLREFEVILKTIR